MRSATKVLYLVLVVFFGSSEFVFGCGANQDLGAVVESPTLLSRLGLAGFWVTLALCGLAVIDATAERQVDLEIGRKGRFRLEHALRARKRGMDRMIGLIVGLALLYTLAVWARDSGLLNGSC